MSKLSERIRSKSFAVTTELTPPKGIDLSDLLGKAEALKDLVDGINLTDSPRARMAIEPKCVGKLLLDRGIEPIVQFTSRDRNRIALQADMLGAALLGIENVVFMGGDDPKNGDHPEAKGVFDLNAADMLRAARALTDGKDMNGNDLKGAPVLFPGATANPGAKDLAAEVQNTRRKIDAGAQFLQTQAVYDPADLLKFVDALKPDGVALLVGIIPLKSHKMATWLNGNVPGIHVPDNLLKELEAVQGDAEAEVRLGIDIAARTIQALKPHCAGVHLMTMGWERYIPDILKASGIR
jgi:methylenetetrahydrofolate reductase (NADPH)